MGFPVHITAAYAVMGLTLGTAISMLYLVVVSLFSKQPELSCISENHTKVSSCRLLRRMFAIAIPVTISSAIMSLTSLLDTVLLQRLLRSAYGMTQEAATTVYGNYTSLAVPMFNLPPVLVYPIAYAIVPYVTKYRTMGKQGEGDLKQLLRGALRMAMLIGTPCALGMAVLAEPILQLLYRSDSAAMAAPLLMLLAPSSLLVCVLAVTNTILQSVGKPGLPVWSMFAGCGVKLAMTVVGIPLWGMAAAPLGTFCCYAVVTTMNLYFVVRYTKLSLRECGWLRIFSAGGICAVCAVTVYNTLGTFMPQKLSVLLAISLAALAYLAALRWMHVLQPEDLFLLPKSKKLANWLGVEPVAGTARQKKTDVLWEVSHGKKQTDSGAGIKA